MNRQNRPFELNRRDLLKWGLAGMAGSALVPGRLYAAEASKEIIKSAGKSAPAKSIIEIWMWGGPAHLDTFDPKPDAGSDYCGPLNKPIETSVDGIRIGQLLPMLAKQAHRYSIIRSMTHGINGHETASYLMQTGRGAGERLVFPSVGAVVSLFKGVDHGYQGLVPPYIVLTSSIGRFSEVGFLGPRYKPFVTGGDPSRTPFAVEGIVAEGITPQRQEKRKELLGQLDTLGNAIPETPVFKKFEQCQENAYNLILGDAGKLFDLAQEKDELRERYGRNKFGQSCLMARRLVEQGVPYITINHGGWDTHKQHFEIMNRKLPEFDRGFSALLEDLDEKGLLDSTIVWCSGEFGRTPKILWEEPWNGGRNHFGSCFSAVVAGGGFKGGCVVGASDAKGNEPADRPVYPQDLIGSIYTLAGIDPAGPMPNPRGMDLKVLPEPTSGGYLREIMKGGQTA